jgi:PBP1b-binding outer membrane lipoprotein LpoB
MSGRGGAGGGAAAITASDVERAKKMKARYVNEFLAYLKKLVADMVRTFPTDPVVARIKNKVTAGAEVNPEKVMTLIGEALASFEEKLESRDEDYFLNNDFKDLADDAKNEEHKRDGLHLADSVKKMYKSLPATRREEYMDMLNDMLDLFYEAVSLARTYRL